ncbi:MAG: hypothetical protein MUP22_06065, partial [Desulfobacterales bacterium]|nr:hypothetical protein [Desulfobacterales bacterium]
MKRSRKKCMMLCIMLLSTLIACRSGMIREVDTIHEIYRGGIDKENIFVSKDFEKSVPVTVAILPFENLSREP